MQVADLKRTRHGVRVQQMKCVGCKMLTGAIKPIHKSQCLKEQGINRSAGLLHEYWRRLTWVKCEYFFLLCNRQTQVPPDFWEMSVIIPMSVSNP